MNWAWTTSFDQLWRSPTFPMWLILAAAGFFGIILLITLLRAEKSVANGALTVITLLAIGIAVAATMRTFGPGDRGASGETRSPQQTSAVLPALSCIDDLAGETVLAACEKALFGSAESVAAGVSYAGSQITRLTAFGDAAVANKNLTFELLTLRRAIERDRYGLMAQVLMARDQCTPAQCAAFRALTDSHQIVVNMAERTYDALISRYAPSWNAPAAAPVAALLSSVPTGKPTNAEFPTAASTPAVNIMTPEPGPSPSRASASAPASTTTPASAANAALLSPRPTSSASPAALGAAKKPPAAPKPSRAAAAPVQLAPPASAPAAAAND
ncbi:MAG TPA: hypothetical protein VK678_24165 [Bradyrhizobium sp.]|nr:hypothetical protein [Bradyrhizobium sp.]